MISVYYSVDFLDKKPGRKVSFTIICCFSTVSLEYNNNKQTRYNVLISELFQSQTVCLLAVAPYFKVTFSQLPVRLSAVASALEVSLPTSAFLYLYLAPCVAPLLCLPVQIFNLMPNQ